jgi:hypothetical protein
MRVLEQTDLVAVLRHRVDSNARRAVETYRRSVADYGEGSAVLIPDSALLELARFTRLLTLDRAVDDQPLGTDDLAAIRANGQLRGEAGVSLSSQQHALRLHTALMLEEISDAATTAQADGVFRLIRWLGREGDRARGAFFDGYLCGVGRARSLPAQVRMIAKALLDDEPVSSTIGDRARVSSSGHYLVVVVRVAGRGLSAHARERVIESVLGQWRVPMTWVGRSELVVLAPARADEMSAMPQLPRGNPIDKPDELGDRTLALVRAVAAETGRPCSVGAAPGRTGELAEPLARARRISKASPPEREPDGVYTLADRFIELGAHAPEVDGWLREIVDVLEKGSELTLTLDAFYRNDLSRTATASALNVHRRTLDYRLQRVHELTGLRPSSTRGVRILSAAVTRALADGWS